MARLELLLIVFVILGLPINVFTYNTTSPVNTSNSNTTREILQLPVDVDPSTPNTTSEILHLPVNISTSYTTHVNLSSSFKIPTSITMRTKIPHIREFLVEFVNI